MNRNGSRLSSKALQDKSLVSWLPIMCILAIASGLYAYKIEAEGMWLDELTSLEDIQDGDGLPPQNLFRPLYYVLLKGWFHFGSSDAWLRGMSVIFAVMTIFLLYRLGERLLGRGQALTAATLMALSPLFINHAQEVRMYTLSTCMTLAGTLFLANGLLSENSRKPSHASLLGWCSFRLLAILTVPLNITLLFADVVAVGLRFRHQRGALLRFGAWLGVLLVVWSPCIFSVIQTTAPDAPYSLHHIGRVPPGIDDAIRIFKFLTVWPFAVQTNAIAALFYKAFTLLLIGLISLALLRKHQSQSLLWIASWFFLPLIPIFAFSYVSTPIWVIRYLLFVSPYLFLLLAAALGQLWQQWRPAAVLIGLVYLLMVSGGLVRYYSVQDRPDYKFIVETIEQLEKPGDVIVWSHFYKKALPHYYQGPSEVIYNPTRDIDSAADIEAWLNNFPETPSRIWLVLNGKAKNHESIKEQIESMFTVKAEFQYDQGSKVLFLSDL
ncbi:MAG: glycosyltransferase family 39 protein [Phormidesmis sp.]